MGLIFGVPGLIIWGIALPYSVIKDLKNDSQDIWEPEERIEKEVVISSYKFTGYFWPSVICILTFVSVRGKLLQALVMSFVISIFTIWYCHTKPFPDLGYNLMGLSSLFAMFMFCYFGYFFLAEVESEQLTSASDKDFALPVWLENSFFFFILAFQFLFVYIW